jgi:hypothetical protein
MVDVVVDQGLLRARNGALDRVQLLDELKARPFGFHHGDDAVEVAGSTLQGLENLRVSLVELGHGAYPIPWIG